MVTVSFHAVLCCYDVNHTTVNNLKPTRPKLPIARQKSSSPDAIESVSASSSYSHFCSLRLVRLSFSRPSTTVCSLKRHELVNSTVLSDTFNSYVLDGVEVGLSSTASGIPKVSIPSLPEEDNSAEIRSCVWEWKPKLNVYYETSGSDNVDFPPILLLPGFGVGSFHYKKQLKDLGRDYRVWALDFLGQGLSLPHEDPTLQSKNGNAFMAHRENGTWGFGDESEAWAEELVYSVDLWKDQVRAFVEEVIKEPVYVVGNSLGGFVALYVAACSPELVKGITLLNATPFWAFLPNPERSPTLSRLFPWAGTFPLPSSVRKLIQILWQKISDPRSISEILRQVYADHTTDVDEVFSRIMETTRHPAAAASLASIMFAPRAKLSFKETLSRIPSAALRLSDFSAALRVSEVGTFTFGPFSLLSVGTQSGTWDFRDSILSQSRLSTQTHYTVERCQMNNIPICLAYGKEDPWVMPICGWQVKRHAPDALYYEISPAGHCPHDEVPEVVNFLLRGWIRNLESNGSISLPLLEDDENVFLEIIKDLEFSRKGSKKSVRVEFHGSDLSIWNWLRSQFKSHVPKITKVLQI